MVSLKMTPAAAKAEGYGSPEEIKPPEYPWGTRLTINNEAVTALFPKGLPKVGDECAITGKVRVIGVIEEDRQDSPPRLSVDLQVTDLEIPQGEEKPSAASRMYGEDGPRQSKD